MSPAARDPRAVPNARAEVDPALLVGTAFLLGAYICASPGATLTAAALIFWALRRRTTRLWLALSVAALALSGVRATSARRDFEARYLAAKAALPAPLRCAGNAEVVSSPVLRGDVTTYLADFALLHCEGRELAGPWRARLYSPVRDAARGEVRSVIVQIAPVRLFRNFAVSDPTWHAARAGAVLSGTTLADDLERGARGWRTLVDRARAHSRERITATFTPLVVPMARALVLGENDLDPEDDAAFRKSGLAHVLAVSGTHLVFAVLALVRALAFCLVRIEALAARYDVTRFAAGFGLFLALIYADYAGGSGSAWRAAWMLAAAFVARALGRRPRVARSIAASFIVGALLDPLAAFDVSFLLSAAATGGLCLLGRAAAPTLERIQWRPLRYLALSALATLSASVPCAPLLALLSPEQTLAGIGANLLAGPVGELLALPFSLAHGLLFFWPSAEQGAARIASGALIVVRAIALASSRIELLAWTAPAPSDWQLAVLAAGSALGWSLARTADASARRCSAVLLAMGGFGALTLLELQLRTLGAPTTALRVTMLDVGQGDSVLVDLPDGRLLLVDGGGFVGSPVDPGRSVILPALRARRRSKVDVMVLSHPHPDHFGGLVAVAETLPVGEFWDTGQGEAEAGGSPGSGYQRLLSVLRARGTLVRRPADLCQAPQMVAAAELRVLAPCPAFVSGRNANDNSLVLRIGYGEHAVLLTGDAEHEEEQELVARHAAELRADLLKVGHHGSRTSSSEHFLAYVRPSLAFVSTGVRNRFGHPHAAALERLAGARAVAWRTDQGGALEWRSDGSAVFVRAVMTYAGKR